MSGASLSERRAAKLSTGRATEQSLTQSLAVFIHHLTLKIFCHASAEFWLNKWGSENLFAAPGLLRTRFDQRCERVVHNTYE